MTRVPTVLLILEYISHTLLVVLNFNPPLFIPATSLTPAPCFLVPPLPLSFPSPFVPPPSLAFPLPVPTPSPLISEVTSLSSFTKDCFYSCKAQYEVPQKTENPTLIPASGCFKTSRVDWICQSRTW